MSCDPKLFNFGSYRYNAMTEKTFKENSPLRSAEPESLVHPKRLVAEVTSSSDDADEFIDAIGISETTTLAEEIPVGEICPTGTKGKPNEAYEIQISAHGYEAPIRKKFENLD